MRALLKPSRVLLIGCVIGVFFITFKLLFDNNSSSDLTGYSPTDSIDFEAIALRHDRLNETGFPSLIVPNIVHYVRFEDHYVDFIMYVSIKSVLLHQQPDKIYIHCDCDVLRGKYWDFLAAENTLSNIIEIKRLEKPLKVFGQTLSSVYHASDVARLKVMMDSGGIFLDNDVYVIKSLDEFRNYEFALGWPQGDFLGTQVLIGHKNSRFLKQWLHSYKGNYEPTKWYFNAGELPTNKILKPRPELIHRVENEFGVQILVPQLYKDNVPESKWKSDYFAVHLLARHRSYLVSDPNAPKHFNEENIKTYNKTFGAMARLVLFGSADLIQLPVE